MKNILIFSLMIGIISLSVSLSGQTNMYHPTFVKKAVYADVTPPLREMKLIQIYKEKNALDREVPNKIGMKEYNNRITQPFLLPEDPVWQKQNGTYSPINSAPIQNFEGISNLSGVYPPDPQGDVGPDKYIQVVNSNFAVYSKTGGVLLGPAALSTIWTGIPAPWNGTNSGDPVVLYDQAASRWMITQFSLPSGNYAELVAISQTSDPTGAWYRYVFQFGNKMPDYPKFGIWPDGYYLSLNQFIGGSTWGGVGTCALERTKMLAGDPTAQMVYFDLGATGDPWAMLPSDWDGTTAPLPNEPNYFSYFNDWSSATEDYLKIWQFHVDWTTTTNSTFSEAASLVTTSFDSQLCTANRGQCISQPGTSVKLESLSDRLMYRLQYRNFGGYRAMVTNHTVDVDGNGRAGIRWYELRNTGSSWTIYQQGTYSPDASNRWVGSIAMNTNGDIALGYSVSNSTSVYPSIRYTGRRATDALGQMTVAEQTIIDGTGNQTGTYARWGDYAGMSVDPVDDQTFWFTSEYIQTSGQANWKTRIASFKFSNNPTVTTLAATAVTGSSATLNGMVNPNGLSTTYYFQWGSTTSYGNTTTSFSAGSGTSNLNVSANITGLSPGGTYHFRLVAINSDGTTNGNDMTVIPGAAALTTTGATAVTQNSATSGGNVTADGGSAVTARGVCWATTANPVATGNHTTDGSGTGTFTSSITGLSSTTLYHVRAYATNANGTFYGTDLTFTTLCGIINSFPWNEGFENAGVIPTCWTQEQVNASGINWTFINGSGNSHPVGAHGGTYNACLKDVTAADNKTRLITPTLNLTSVSNPQLKFWHTQAVWSTDQDQLIVFYKNSAGGAWTQLAAFTASITAWTLETISLPNPTSDYYIAFEGNAKYGYGVCVDDVSIVSSCASYLPVSISIGASANPVCAGTSVTFTPTPVNGGTPTYQWYKNGVAVGTGVTYSYIPLNSDQVYVIMTSSLSCTSGSPATSNTVTMTVNPVLPVSVSIAASANPVCDGTSITFTPTPVNGGTPAYQWYKNTVVVGPGSTYSYVPANGDQVYVKMTSSLSCKSGSPATSNTLTMNVYPPLTANFMADNLIPPKNQTVQFTDLTTGGATAWNWSFDRPGVVFVNSTNASSKNPQVQFTDGGLYQVTLVATHLPCSDSEIKSGYLRAGLPGIWTGNTSSDWSILSNWDNYLVPDGNIDVVIPSSASFWPVFSGDFTLGIDGRNLILSGASSQITITGNLVIQ